MLVSTHPSPIHSTLRKDTHERLSDGFPIQLLQEPPNKSPFLANPSNLPTLCRGIYCHL